MPSELTPAELNRLRYNAPLEQVVVHAILAGAPSLPLDLVRRALWHREHELSASIAAGDVHGGFVGNGFGPLPEATAMIRRRQALRWPFKAHRSLWANRRVRISAPHGRARERRPSRRSRVVRRAQARSPGRLDPDEPDERLARAALRLLVPAALRPTERRPQ